MEKENPEKDPQAETRLEKVMKEKFGTSDFSGLMNSIVEQMMDTMKDSGESQPEEKKP
ncbi:MAG: hypothetical protein JWO30_1431 [Fibrobacteres bacterium]|nr:hypothetical protein [Fibrobacterota bacterium]